MDQAYRKQFFRSKETIYYLGQKFGEILYKMLFGEIRKVGKFIL